MSTYTCESHRPVAAQDMREAAEIFAGRKARKAYGRGGYARTCSLESWSRDDHTVGEYNAFIGYRTGRNETTGRNVRFTVYAPKGGAS